MGQGTEKGTDLIAEALNFILTRKQTTTVLLETMAGKGSEVGGTFGEIRAIIEKVKLDEKIGEGAIGIKAISQFINHPKLRKLPFYLETPNELDGYAQEIKLLRSLYVE